MEDKKEVKPPKLIRIKNGDPCFVGKEFEEWLKSQPKEVQWEPLADTSILRMVAPFNTKTANRF
jgi:hypothetical protein